ncbi:BirA family transcriptional regulator, biotin operon repressor / biotin-[acetyl-CoA-carboxylase] ligase [Fibrobacter sp. UWH5]|nr:biotin--[acetyl-CoA-carboxylase] ligase [Fibrobacter sp. UWH5]SHK88402.1 BirA family transcriptional regulator, biotin operon repressor / biotin-[acetyl-CoA-carboxylase] ligase [Fibrobacter sp. UWH5]
MFSTEPNFDRWKLTGFAGQNAYLLETVESTHSLMKQQAATGKIQPGALVVANQQTAGRGRHERTWASPANENLYFNILIPLEGIALSKAPQITQVAALTFAETFRDLQDESGTAPQLGRVTVKWPNDILCGKSKFCGILAEIVFVPGETVDGKRQPPRPAVNMGVGINVNSDPANYAFLNRPVTTLKEIAGGRQINREKLLQALVGNLERAIGQFRAFGLSPWIEAWRKMDQFIGARGTIVVNNNCTDENRDSGAGSIKKSGRILDMQPDGSLLFETDDGTVETVYSADLEI